MTYERPLAYLLGIEGVALLRGSTGSSPRPGRRGPPAARRRSLTDAGVVVEQLDAVDGYCRAANAGRPVTVIWWFARESVAAPAVRPAR